MKLKSFLTAVAFAGVLGCTLGSASSSQAETLDTQATRRSVSAVDVPVRGLTMAQVERRYGAPAEKLAPAGGDTRLHPVIHRWRYAGYTVYFERNRVIHSVRDAGVIQGS
jgi:hypothetical protein